MLFIRKQPPLSCFPHPAAAPAATTSISNKEVHQFENNLGSILQTFHGGGLAPRCEGHKRLDNTMAKSLHDENQLHFSCEPHALGSLVSVPHVNPMIVRSCKPHFSIGQIPH